MSNSDAPYGSDNYRDPVGALARRMAARKKKKSTALDKAAKAAGAAAGTLSASNIPAYGKRVQAVDEDIAMRERQLRRKRQ